MDTTCWCSLPASASYVKHVSAPFNVFWVGGGGASKGAGHNLHMQFSSLGSSKMVVTLPSSRCLAVPKSVALEGTTRGQWWQIFVEIESSNMFETPGAWEAQTES